LFKIVYISTTYYFLLQALQSSSHAATSASFWDILHGIVTNDTPRGTKCIIVTNGLLVHRFYTTFAEPMRKGQQDTINTRIISTAFIVLALAVFKPFGLKAWQWMGLAHLLVIFLLGIVSCMLSEGILKYVIRKPRSLERGVDYIISRNLWFQLINTPLVSLLICLYRHYVMSDLVPGNVLSWSNYFETLLIIAFGSFAIGLYWRFKYRSKYLTAELEETRLLNKQLQRLQQETEQRVLMAEQAAASHKTEQQQQPSINAAQLPQAITLTGSTSETVMLRIADLLYIEAVGNYVKIYQWREDGVQSSMLRATSKQMEDDLRDYPMIVRCHRAFLVNLHQVEEIVSRSGSMQLLIKHSHDALPVSRSNMAQVKAAINRL